MHVTRRFIYLLSQKCFSDQTKGDAVRSALNELMEDLDPTEAQEEDMKKRVYEALSEIEARPYVSIDRIVTILSHPADVRRYIATELDSGAFAVVDAWTGQHICVCEELNGDVGSAEMRAEVIAELLRREDINFPDGIPSIFKDAFESESEKKTTPVAD